MRPPPPPRTSPGRGLPGFGLRRSASRCRRPPTAPRRPAPWCCSATGRRASSSASRRRIAGLLALELARDDGPAGPRRGPPGGGAAGAGPPWVVRRSPARSAPDLPVELAEREETRRELRRLAPARRMALRGRCDEPRAPARPRRRRRRIRAGSGWPAGSAAFLGRGVAVSRPFGDPVDRAAAEADARATLEAAETLRTPPPVARADRLPAYRLLGNLHNLPDGPRQARALLEPLLVGVRGDRRERLATLRALLDRPGIAEAAAALGVHRNTVAYRVRRIEAMTGWRLDDPDLRFAARARASTCAR